MKILFYDEKTYDKTSFDEALHNFPDLEVDYAKTDLDSRTAALADGFDAVCGFVSSDIGAQTLSILHEKGVRLILLRCAGFNNVDLAHKGNIRVVRVPQYSPYAVAEHAVALLLNITRKLYKSYQRTRKYNFTIDGLLGFDIHGKTIGVIGTGRIGKVFIQIMKGFGTNVIAYDLYPDKKAEEELGFKYVSLDELYAKSDIISLHCPLTPETENIINDKSIKKMKDGVILINCSRGKLIDTKSLIKEMENGKIGGVGLDVYEDEDEFFLRDMSNSYKRDNNLSILLSMPNLIITSHQAFFTSEALNKIASDTCKNIKDIFDNKDCMNELK